MHALTADASEPDSCTEQARIDLQTAYDKANAQLRAAIIEENNAAWTAHYFENMAAEYPDDTFPEDAARWRDRFSVAKDARRDAQRAVTAYRAGLDALTAN